MDEVPTEMSNSTISSVAFRTVEEALSYALSVLGTPERILKEEHKEVLKLFMMARMSLCGFRLDSAKSFVPYPWFRVL